MPEMANLHRAFIGIGSNLGNRLPTLGWARQALGTLSSEVICSAVYETEPEDYVDQPRFLNMVVGMEVALPPLALLDRLQALEAAAGRARTVRYGPRTLDLDVLLYDNLEMCGESLQIPHPRMWERGFVLIPLADLIPDWSLPNGKRIAELAAQFRNKGDVKYVGRFW